MSKVIQLCSLALCLLSIGAAASAQVDSNGPGPACDTQITACGCVIKSQDIYTVENDLNARQTQRANCIEVAPAAAHSVLNLKGHQVIGKNNGTGTGILIRQGADHVVIQGASQAVQFHPDDDPCAPTGSQAIVTKWDIGIEDDADNAVIQLFDGLGGTSETAGNATAGLYINGVTGTMASAMIACHNGQAGVIVRNSANVSILNATTNNNDEAGIWLDASNRSTVSTVTANNNRRYGVWLARSSHNKVANYGASQNGDTGTLLGCGPLHCTGQETSNNNHLSLGGNNGNGTAGIYIEHKSDNNTVTITTDTGNQGDYDMVDENAHCGTNTWYNNTGTSSRNCMQ